MLTSYWIESAPLPRFPQLDRNVSVDVIVVGGGIMGVTAAYLAKQAGKTVALIERDRCASVDTGHTTAHLTAVTDLRLHQIDRTFGHDSALATWHAGMAAIDQIVSLIRRHDIECDFRWVPGYLHASIRDPDPKRIDDLEKEAAIATELGIGCEFMSSVPVFNVPGLKFRHQAIFHPRKYLRPLLEQIPGNGSHVFENTSADEVTADPLAVKCGDHSVRGEYLILATHTPLQGATGLFSALLLQTKLSLYTSYAIGGKIPDNRLPHACYWDNADPYDYLRVEPRRGHDYLIFGGEDHKTGQLEDTLEPYRKLEDRLRRFALDVEIDHRWSGQVIETNDGLPLMGETAERQFAATGFGGNGMTFGTLSAMMAVDRLLGRENPWTDLFDIHRKKIRGGTWTYLVENKDYPYLLVRDRIGRSEGDSLDQLGKGEGKVLKLDGQKVAAFRDEQGQVTQCSPVCPHLGCIVEWNNAEKTWDCPCHGSRFKPSGEVISGPAETSLEKISKD